MELRRRIGPVLTPPPPYPWRDWQDGYRHTIYQGIDFDLDPAAMSKSIRQRAVVLRRRGEPVRVTTKIDNDAATVVFQFVKITMDE